MENEMKWKLELYGFLGMSIFCPSTPEHRTVDVHAQCVDQTLQVYKDGQVISIHDCSQIGGRGGRSSNRVEVLVQLCLLRYLYSQKVHVPLTSPKSRTQQWYIRSISPRAQIVINWMCPLTTCMSPASKGNPLCQTQQPRVLRDFS